MNMQMSVTGVTAVIGKLTKLNADLQSANARSVKTAAFDMVGQTKGQITQNKSVISGTLRRSINAEPLEPLLWRVGTNVFYAPYVEARKPYLQPSVDIVRTRYLHIVVEDIEGVI